MAAEIILRLERIGRAYKEADRELIILNDADFTLRRGEMVALVAPSGAGKSTLLHTAGFWSALTVVMSFWTDVPVASFRMMSAPPCAATMSALSISSITSCRSFPHWKM